MASVELSLSETFHKHKRNLVLLCSAVTVLRIASPAKLKLPFVGAEVDLPSSIAFILLSLALIYMFSQYYIEYRTMIARHSSEIVGAPKKTVDEVIDSHLQDMESWVSVPDNREALKIREGFEHMAPDKHKETIDHIFNDYLNIIKSSLLANGQDHRGRTIPITVGDKAHIAEVFEAIIKERFDKALAQHYNSIKGYHDAIVVKIDNIELSQALVTDRLTEYSKTYREVAKSFKTLASSIGAAQRIGFKWIDGYLVIAFAALALVSCVTGALGWWIDPPTPSVEKQRITTLHPLVQRANTTVPTPE